MEGINVGTILGGFGLFMFGIHFMGDGLKAAAGDKLKDIINKYTSNTIKASIVGFIITALLQSSSATTAITISLVRAGLMSFEQSVGVMLGAAVGTTITSFLISMNLDQYAMYIIFLGTMLITFSKKKEYMYIGDVILGFGLIFFGMNSMGDSLSALKETPLFENLILQMSNMPLLSALVGILFTAVIQSSDATIGIVQKLYQAGAIPFLTVLPFMFGAYAGTTITGIFASMGGAISGKRAAVVNTIIGVIAMLVGLLTYQPLSNLILKAVSLLNPMMQVAFTNIFFKLLTALLLIPFASQLVKITKKIIPSEEDDQVEVDVNELDESIGTILPSAAIYVSKQAILKMIDMVRLNSVSAMELLNIKGTSNDKEKIDKNEAIINRIDQKITSYLINMSTKNNLTNRDIGDIRTQLDAVKNLERVGDLACNLSEFITMVYDANQSYSEASIKDLEKMFNRFIDMFDLTAEIFMTKNRDDYEKLKGMELELDQMELDYRDAHFVRMGNDQCNSAVAESVYCDFLGTIERMGDHLNNIAKSVMTRSTTDISDDEVIAKRI